MMSRLCITALLAFGLSACAELALLQSPGVPADEGAREQSALYSDAVPVADEIRWGLDFEEPEELQAALGNPPMPRRKPDRNVPAVAAAPDPDLLVGLDFEATKALLGDPAIKMEQPPAKIWAYNGGSCMFSVFFYPSMDDSVFRVLTYEVSGKEPELPVQTASRTTETGVAKISDRASPILRRCFADLLQERDIQDAG